ncbi:hypothetical protein L6164_007179 [Bauhinia variegata]|uniref:Uncharacterized protein n=1 Tax=Bauhinia variegata TaxID=167791 RepID=A0ACB9PVW6_BAUVA|nr:hypothetical protein L6164_007179 [Bauhinia variegata]
MVRLTEVPQRCDRSTVKGKTGVESVSPESEAVVTERERGSRKSQDLSTSWGTLQDVLQGTETFDCQLRQSSTRVEHLSFYTKLMTY